MTVAATSLAAYGSVKEYIPNQKERILQEITLSEGLIAEEVAERLGLRLSSVTARINELWNAEHITGTGELRPTSSGRAAVVWVAT